MFSAQYWWHVTLGRDGLDLYITRCGKDGTLLDLHYFCLKAWIHCFLICRQVCEHIQLCLHNSYTNVCLQSAACEKEQSVSVQGRVVICSYGYVADCRCVDTRNLWETKDFSSGISRPRQVLSILVLILSCLAPDWRVNKETVWDTLVRLKVKEHFSKWRHLDNSFYRPRQKC